MYETKKPYRYLPVLVESSKTRVHSARNKIKSHSKINDFSANRHDYCSWGKTSANECLQSIISTPGCRREVPFSSLTDTKPKLEHRIYTQNIYNTKTPL